MSWLDGNWCHLKHGHARFILESVDLGMGDVFRQNVCLNQKCKEH